MSNCLDELFSRKSLWIGIDAAVDTTTSYQLNVTALVTIRYYAIRYIYVRSKADEMASLVYRTAQKQKNKEKLKTVAETWLDCAVQHAIGDPKDRTHFHTVRWVRRLSVLSVVPTLQSTLCLTERTRVSCDLWIHIYSTGAANVANMTGVPKLGHVGVTEFDCLSTSWIHNISLVWSTLHHLQLEGNRGAYIF